MFDFVVIFLMIMILESVILSIGYNCGYNETKEHINILREIIMRQKRIIDIYEDKLEG